MIINTRIFGEIEIEDSKIITFANGIVGFPDLTEFALVHNEEKGKNSNVKWLQSIQEPSFALPVIDPLAVFPEYNPEVDDDLLKPLGNIDPEEILVLVTLTVPKVIEEMSVNLKAPIVISAKNKKACQVIAEGNDYSVKYKIYHILEAFKNAK